MFQPWRLKLREAEEAYRAGRLDDACRLLADEELGQYLPTQRLLAKVAKDVVRRGNDSCQQGDTLAGWRDFDVAKYLGAKEEAVRELRDALLARAIDEFDASIRAGDVESAERAVDKLRKRNYASGEIRAMDKVTKAVQQAERLRRMGKFGDAATQYAVAAELRPQLTALTEKADACRRHVAEVRQLGQETHEAIAAEDWNRVVVTADRWLELAPESKLAQDARRRAWAAVGMRTSMVGGRRAERATLAPANGTATTDSRSHAVSTPVEPPQRESVVMIHCAEDDEVVADLVPDPRFLLWVDAVGGFLVCTRDTVTLGQPEGSGAADIPILGDVSARHAVVRRAGEGYLIEPIRETAVDGKPISSVATLTDGCEIQLGDSVRLRFRRPHALSATARLEFVSHHRTQPACDGIILMAESCVLGPGAHDHIACADWPEAVVLYRQDDTLYCRSSAPLEIDGVVAGDRQPVEMGSRIAGEQFSMSLEAV